MKSVYTFRSNEDVKIQISFELDDKEESQSLRDVRALDYLSSYILKCGEDETNERFYLDDVQIIKEE